MTAIIADPNTVEPLERVRIECAAPEKELLLAEWLNCLIYAMATRRMLLSRFSIEIDGARLKGVAWGRARGPKPASPGG